MTVASQALTGPAQGPWDKHDGRYTLRVLGFIENRLGNALMQTLNHWFWRRSKLLEADAHGVPLRCSRALLLAPTSGQQPVFPWRNFWLRTLFFAQLRLLSLEKQLDSCVFFSKGSAN